MDCDLFNKLATIHKSQDFALAMIEHISIGSIERLIDERKKTFTLIERFGNS